jgi:dienelactone hydrolase
LLFKRILKNSKEETIMIFRKPLMFLAGISLVLLTSTTIVAQVTDGGYRIFRPDGPGPHPAVVFVGGVSGLTPAFAPKAYERFAEQLRELGFAVVWADFLGRRNLKNNNNGQVSPAEAGRDAVEAASWLRSQSYVDTKRITVMGWSFGGGAVLTALGMYSADQLIFSRAIVYYPFCTGVPPWSNRIPTLVLRAGSDNVALPQWCASALGTGSGTANVKIIDYPGAQHMFGVSEVPPKMETEYGTIGYNPQAAAAAWEEVKQFLQSEK